MRNLLDFLVRNQFLLLAGSAALLLLLLAAGIVIPYVSQWLDDRRGILSAHYSIDTPGSRTGIIIIVSAVLIMFIVLGYLEPLSKTAALALPELSRDSPTNT